MTTLGLVDDLAKLMNKHRINVIEVGSIKLAKTIHEFDSSQAVKIDPTKIKDQDEEDLYWSSSAPV